MDDRQENGGGEQAEYQAAMLHLIFMMQLSNKNFKFRENVVVREFAKRQYQKCLSVARYPVMEMGSFDSEAVWLCEPTAPLRMTVL